METTSEFIKKRANIKNFKKKFFLIIFYISLNFFIFFTINDYTKVNNLKKNELIEISDMESTSTGIIFKKKNIRHLSDLTLGMHMKMWEIGVFLFIGEATLGTLTAIIENFDKINAKGAVKEAINKISNQVTMFIIITNDGILLIASINLFQYPYEFSKNWIVYILYYLSVFYALIGIFQSFCIVRDLLKEDSSDCLFILKGFRIMGIFFCIPFTGICRFMSLTDGECREDTYTVTTYKDGSKSDNKCSVECSNCIFYIIKRVLFLLAILLYYICWVLIFIIYLIIVIICFIILGIIYGIYLLIECIMGNNKSRNIDISKKYNNSAESLVNDRLNQNEDIILPQDNNYDDNKKEINLYPVDENLKNNEPLPIEKNNKTENNDNLVNDLIQNDNNNNIYFNNNIVQNNNNIQNDKIYYNDESAKNDGIINNENIIPDQQKYQANSTL